MKSYHMASQIYTATASYRETSRAFVTKDGAAPTAHFACALATALAMARVLKMALASAIRIGEARTVRSLGAQMNAMITAHVLEGKDACAIWASTDWIVESRHVHKIAQAEACAFTPRVFYTQATCSKMMQRRATKPASTILFLAACAFMDGVGMTALK